MDPIKSKHNTDTTIPTSIWLAYVEAFLWPISLDPGKGHMSTHRGSHRGHPALGLSSLAGAGATRLTASQHTNVMKEPQVAGRQRYSRLLLEQWPHHVMLKMLSHMQGLIHNDRQHED